MKERNNKMNKPIFKDNLLKLVLKEAKKNNLKWLFQVSGENVYPNNDQPDDYENWQYTNNVTNSLKEASDYGYCIDIVFNNGNWIRYLDQYDDKSCIENISDYTIGNGWVDNFISKLENNYQLN